MDIDETIQIILKHRQAFAFGVTGVETLFNIGSGWTGIGSTTNKVS